MLSDRTEVVVKFNEADPLGIVWHGHYIRYFEDGREAFGKKFGIAYLDFYHNGLAVPVVSVNCDYKKPLRYGDSVIVETTFINSRAAKLKFNYKMFESKSGNLVAIGSSMQVFVNARSFELELTMPKFVEDWKKKWDLS